MTAGRKIYPEPEWSGVITNVREASPITHCQSDQDWEDKQWEKELSTRKKAARWFLAGLLLAGSFLAGRAEGWYEAHLFMKQVAHDLGVMTQ